MSNRKRTRALRIAIAFEAEALIANSGAAAYWVARRRAEEASSDEMASDLSGVAAAIARKTGKPPPSLFAMLR